MNKLRQGVVFFAIIFFTVQKLSTEIVHKLVELCFC
jgi:hypothetical protein